VRGAITPGKGGVEGAADTASGIRTGRGVDDAAAPLTASPISDDGVPDEGVDTACASITDSGGLAAASTTASLDPIDDLGDE